MVVGVEGVAEAAAVDAEAGTVTLFLMAGEARVDVECPGGVLPQPCAVFGDNVDHASSGVTAVECAGGSFHDLDALHV